MLHSKTKNIKKITPFSYYSLCFRLFFLLYSGLKAFFFDRKVLLMGYEPHPDKSIDNNQEGHR